MKFFIQSSKLASTNSYTQILSSVLLFSSNPQMRNQHHPLPNARVLAKAKIYPQTSKLGAELEAKVGSQTQLFRC